MSNLKQKVHPMDHSNLIGSCLCFFWCNIVLYFKYNQKRMMMVLYIALFIVMSVVIVLVECYLIIKMEDKTSKFFDVLGAVINVLMYISPGLNVIYLFKQKKPEFIRIETVFCGSINSLVWLLWAIKSKISHSTIANGIGLVLCVAQIVYFMICYKHTIRYDEKKFLPILDDENTGENNVKETKSDEKEKVAETDAEKLNNEIDNFM